MKHKQFAAALQAVSNALAVAFKMNGEKRYLDHKIMAATLIDNLKPHLGESIDDAQMLTVLEACESIMNRVEFQLYEEK